MDRKPNSSMPLISIITPSFNQGEFIVKTIESVLSQDYPNFEFIVVDNCSTDNTLDILKKYRERFTWISEPDRGQADAVNKGFRMAKGDILNWVNSDDTLNPGALRKAANQFLTHEELIMVYSDAHLMNKDGEIKGNYLTEAYSFKRLADTCFICQPTVFIRSNVIKEVGLLNTALQTALDYEYWIRIGMQYPTHRISYLKGEYLANSRVYHESKTIALRKKVYKECMKIQKKYFGRVSFMWIYGYIKEIILGIRYKGM